MRGLWTGSLEGRCYSTQGLVAEAAAAALADSSNPYTALRGFLHAGAISSKKPDAPVAKPAGRSCLAELKGLWHDTGKQVAERQNRPRVRVSPPTVDVTAGVFYLMTAAGEVLHMLSSGENNPALVASDQ